MRRYSISRPTGDPSYVIIDLEFDTAGDAEGLRAKLERLWAGAGTALGLQDIRTRIIDVVERRDI